MCYNGNTCRTVRSLSLSRMAIGKLRLREIVEIEPVTKNGDTVDLLIDLFWTSMQGARPDCGLPEHGW